MSRDALVSALRALAAALPRDVVAEAFPPSLRRDTCAVGRNVWPEYAEAVRLADEDVVTDAGAIEKTAAVLHFRALLAAGGSKNAAALRMRVPLCTLFRWAARFDNGGVSALISRKSPGRPRKNHS